MVWADFGYYLEEKTLQNTQLVIKNKGLEVVIDGKMFRKNSLHYKYSHPNEVMGFNDYFGQNMSKEDGYLISPDRKKKRII